MIAEVLPSLFSSCHTLTSKRLSTAIAWIVLVVAVVMLLSLLCFNSRNGKHFALSLVEPPSPTQKKRKTKESLEIPKAVYRHFFKSSTATDLSEKHAASLPELPSGDHATSNTPPFPRNVLTSSPSATFQTWTLRSNEPGARSFPSGENAAE